MDVDSYRNLSDQVGKRLTWIETCNSSGVLQAAEKLKESYPNL